MNTITESQYLSWVMKVRTLSPVKPKPRNVSVQMGVKTQTPTVRAPPRSTRDSGASNQRPSLTSNFRGRTSLCRSGSNSSGPLDNRLFPTLCSEPSKPSKPSSSFPPSPPICSPKLVKKSREEVHYDSFIHSRLDRMWEVNTVIPRLTKIIRSGITFVSRNVISRRFL